MDEMILTYQTRLVLSQEQEHILQEYAALLSSVQHKLYAEVAKGRKPAACKNEFLKKFDITARQFNSCRASLDGKIAACQAGQERAIITLTQQIKDLNSKIKLLERKPSKQFTLHQKKRRLSILEQRLAKRKEDLEQKRTRLCFGGKKLFSAQFYLDKNGFKSHLEWKKAWQAQRTSEFLLLGSKDETSGNQSCTAGWQPDGKLSLRLRLPNHLEARNGKYLRFENLFFAYGHKEILAALNNPKGQALTYRFKKDSKGWRVFVSVAMHKEKQNFPKGNGAIGLDLNVDHIAYVETDRFGNPIDKKTFAWHAYGKTNRQLKALTGNLCKEIINLAAVAKKPIVIEKLDFQKKKLALKDSYKPSFARLLSSFAYGLFFSSLMARAFKLGCSIYQVNPAFTSTIGQVNYATRYGLSIHLAAALSVARRYLNFSEAPISSASKIPSGKGNHVAFILPVRNRTKHVWLFWGQVRRKLRTVHAAHNLARNRSKSPLKTDFCDSNSS
jgi:IS605 OrfB family transposase